MSMIHMNKSRAMKECEGARIPPIIVDVIAFLAIFFTFQQVAPKLMSPIIRLLLQGKSGIDAYVITTIAHCMMFLVLTSLSILYCLLVQKRSITSMGFYGNVGISALAGLGAGFGLTVLVAGIQIALGAGRIEWSGTLPVSVFILFLLGTFIQSSGEEVLCRGFLMNGLGGRHSWMFAVAVNSVVFGVLHIFNPGVTPLPIINVTIAGVFFSVVTLRYNLWVSCWIHAMWNFSEGYIFGSNISGNESMMSIFAVSPTEGPAWLTGGQFGIEGSIVVTIVYIIGIALVFLLPQSSGKRAEEKA